MGPLRSECPAGEASDNESFQPRTEGLGRGRTGGLGTKQDGNSTWSRGQGRLPEDGGREKGTQDGESLTLNQESRPKKPVSF